MLTLRFLAVRDVSSASIRDEGAVYWSVQIQGEQCTCFIDILGENLQENQEQHTQVREMT